MWQRQWLELMTDYDLEFIYHDRLDNLVTDALSRKSGHSLTVLSGVEELNQYFSKLNFEVIREGELQHYLSALAIQPLFSKEILSLCDKDLKLVMLKEQACKGKAEGFFVHEDGGLRFKGRWCLPMGEPTLKKHILDKAHCSKFSIHLGYDKMYQDLKLIF